jgi:tetratricopeptide (TPR) repeat protein
MRVVAAGVLAAGILALAPIGIAQTPQTTAKPGPASRGPSTREVLDQYLKGDYEAALANPATLGRFNFEDADRWVSSGGTAAAGRRRLAAALFALEYASVRQSNLAALVTWARGVLSRLPPGPNEALWLRASIALAGGWNRWVFLVEGVPTPIAAAKLGQPGVGHIRFARTRFPDDPYLQLGDAIGAEVSAARQLDRLSVPPPQSSTGWDRIAGARLDAGGPRLAERTAALERASGLYERLVSHEVVAAEANLRLGYVRVLQGQSDQALAHFDKVPSLTKDVSLRYLSHLYSGWLLGSLGRTQEAVAAYRAALALVPRAQSATSLLVALLLRNDLLSEAETTADEFLVGPKAASDPWREHYVDFVGEFSAYPRLVRHLREALQ